MLKMDPCSSNKKSSAKRINDRKEKHQQLQLEINAQQRWKQTHGGIIPQTQRSRAGAFSSVFGNEEDEGEYTGCRVSECCSPTSDILGITDPFRRSPEKNLGLSLLGARPLGNIEKVLEYRTILNGESVELRRVTASVEGPVEHLQVVNAPTGAPTALPALIMHQSSHTTQPTRNEVGDKKSRRPNGRGSKNGSRRSSRHGEQGMSSVPSGASTPWLDYEGPPGQHAAVWNGSSTKKEKKQVKQKTRAHGQELQEPDHSSGARTGHSRQIQRLALNGSQPCLMVATPRVSADADIHLHYPQMRRTEQTLMTMDPSIETNTAKFLPMGGGGVSSNMDEFSPNLFDHSSIYQSENTANAQNLSHSKRSSPQKAVTSSGRQQSLPRKHEHGQINIFHNGATHHHYFQQNTGLPQPEAYQYHDQPPRPQSSAATHYPQMYSNRYFSQQTHGFDPYFQVDDDGNSDTRFRVSIFEFYSDQLRYFSPK